LHPRGSASSGEDRGIRLNLGEGLLESLPLSLLLGLVTYASALTTFLIGAAVWPAVVALHHTLWNQIHLAKAFHPAGRVLSLEASAELMAMPTCLGAKHSSLSRRLEWDRLALPNRTRPDFHVFTGNDLAIDLVRYGSDWLLGLSTAWPEAFALRDAWWAAGDRRFDELDAALQALGDFAFRWPVPAYKHSMAQFLHLRGLIGCDATHSQSLPRPESDREILAGLRDRIDAAMAATPEAH
jgi:hypothetical protein